MLKSKLILSETAKQANALLGLNPEAMELPDVRELLSQIGPALAAHDADPAHIIEDKGYWRKLTPTAQKRAEKLSWLVYACSSCIRRHEDPTWQPAGYTGRKSNRK